MNLVRNLFLYVCLAYMVSACVTHRPWYAENYDQSQMADTSVDANEVAYTFYMIGDCGKSSEDAPWPIFDLLKQQLAAEGTNSAVIYLGDNIYEVGLPDSTAADRKEMERRMTAQLQPTKDFAGKVIVIPGNHDWAQGARTGYAARMREEIFVERYLNAGNTYLPDDGCPGPFELSLSDSLVILCYDSQWWLHKHEKPGKAQGCQAETDAEFLANFKAALERNKGKQILVAAHHPQYSYGGHGGYYPASHHLFPMRMFAKNAWVPLPVLGSIAVWYRKFYGNIQDIPNPRYKQMRLKLEALFAQYPGLISMAGHDHNLQYLPIEGRHYIISGAGSKGSYVSHGPRARFTDAEQGFAKLYFFKNGGRRLEFWVTDAEKLPQLRFVEHW